MTCPSNRRCIRTGSRGAAALSSGAETAAAGDVSSRRHDFTTHVATRTNPGLTGHPDLCYN